MQLFAKLQATKQEIVDLQEANVRERQELEQTQNELTRELKLKSVLLLLLVVVLLLLTEVWWADTAALQGAPCHQHHLSWFIH